MSICGNWLDRGRWGYLDWDTVDVVVWAEVVGDAGPELAADTGCDAAGTLNENSTGLEVPEQASSPVIAGMSGNDAVGEA